MKPEHWRRLLAVVSGVALAASDWPLCWTYLHFVALVPLFVGYLAFESPKKLDWGTGAIFVLTYAGLLALSAATVLPVWIAVIWGLMQWTLALGLASRMLGTHWLLGPAFAAAVLTLVELFVWHLVPIFGMAQCFARVTSAVPAVVQFAAYTGLGGVVFALVFSQGLLASLLSRFARPDPDRWKKVTVLVAFLVMLSVVNYMRWHRPLGPTVRVAAYGWSGSHELTLKKMCAAAREAQAEILVTPELGFRVRKEEPELGLQSLASDVRQTQLNAVIGVARLDLFENQALLIDASDLTTYAKSHLIPFMENCRSGGGRRVDREWAGVRCGVMICQDDNFSDLARGYSRDGIQLMLVPTLDWNPICGLHYESSVMRSIENGYAICRAAAGGISALITPRGQVLVSHNHNLHQDALCISGALTVGDGQPTIYAHYGDWPIGWLSLIVCVLAFTVKSKTTQPPPPDQATRAVEHGG